METLAEKMRVRMRRDDCNDRIIIGKHGDVHRGTREGVSGYYVSIMWTSARKFRVELRRCVAIGAEITQEGDTEGVVFVPRSVALANASVIRAAIHARQKRKLSPEAAAAAVETLRRYRDSLATRAVGAGETI